MLDVYKDGKKQFQMLPEKRVYHASQQPQTMVAIHSNILWDLYVIYEGTNPSTGQPIIKAIINPLVSWIWAGVALIVFGTFIATRSQPHSATASLRVPCGSRRAIRAGAPWRRLICARSNSGTCHPEPAGGGCVAESPAPNHLLAQNGPGPAPAGCRCVLLRWARPTPANATTTSTIA